MTAALRTHFAVPFKVSTVGYYVDTACGAYMGGVAFRTEDRAQVTCHGCQRTAAFKANSP